MGIDITMSMGWGIHIPQDVFDGWTEVIDPDHNGDCYEKLDHLIYRENSRLTYSWAGNAWLGESNGLVIYASDTYQHFDMGREAKAGVYRSPVEELSLSSQDQLDEVSVAIADKYLPIEWLVTVGVS